jgi:hypothetical protein
MSTAGQPNRELHKKAVNNARWFYVIVMATFLTIIVVAVTVTMNIERTKPGFKSIHVKQPISFFDKTYLDDQQKAPAEPSQP